MLSTKNKKYQYMYPIEYNGKVYYFNQYQVAMMNMIIHKGLNAMICGVGGSGKSLMIKKIKEELERLGKRVKVVSTSGISAVNVDGVTLQSWACTGIEYEYKEMVKNYDEFNHGRVKNNYTETDTLIIDEVSMLDADLFDNICRLAQRERGNKEFFGGIQIILVGDLLQLSPIKSINGKIQNGKYIFMSKNMKYIQVALQLIESFRQKDAMFKNILSKIRIGHFDEMCKKELRKRVVTNLMIDDDPLIVPTILTTRNREASRINRKFLKEIKKETKLFKGIDMKNDNSYKSNVTQKLNEVTQSEYCLELKDTAQVILTFNIDTANKICNGSRGIITRCIMVDLNTLVDNTRNRYQEEAVVQYFQRNSSNGELLVPVVKFQNSSEEQLIFPVKFTCKTMNGELIRYQFPLKLAWALTIHKCQGLSIDKAKIKSATSDNRFGENEFMKHQLYVALSRVRSLDSLYLDAEIIKSAISVDAVVINFLYKTFGCLDQNKLVRL